MDLENIMLTEISQRKTNTVCEKVLSIFTPSRGHLRPP